MNKKYFDKELFQIGSEFIFRCIDRKCNARSCCRYKIGKIVAYGEKVTNPIRFLVSANEPIEETVQIKFERISGKFSCIDTSSRKHFYEWSDTVERQIHGEHSIMDCVPI